MKRKISIVLLSIVMTVTMMSGTLVGSFAETKEDYSVALSKAQTYVSGQFANYPNYGNEWFAFVAGRSNKVSGATKQAYYKSYGEKLAASDGILKGDNSYVDYERGILALVATGCDPTDVGGYNLVAKLKNTSKVISQGVNAPAFALIALNSTKFGSEYDNAKMEYVNALVKDYQLSDGGWAFGKNASSTDASADVDMTCMAIQALAPYYSSDTNVKIAIDKGLSIIHDRQQTSGEFKSSGSENAESLSQVIVAYTSLGKDPTIELEVDPIKTLLSYQLPTGAFQHIKGDGENGLATVQGTYALIAYDKYVKIKKALYDMSDVTLSKIGITPMSWAKITLSTNSYVYNGAAPTVSVLYAGRSTTGYTVSGLSSGIGSHAVTVVGNGTNYTGSVTLSYTVSKANQSISASRYTWNKFYGNKSFYLGVKRSGNGAVSYKSSNTKVVKVNSSGKITIVGTGRAIITVTAASTGNYNKAARTITVNVAPKKETIKSLKKYSRAFYVKWVKDTRASGYQVQYAKNSKFTSSRKTVSITKNKYYSKKITKLSKKKTYYVRVRSYKTVGKTKLYGAWSSVRKVKVN